MEFLGQKFDKRFGSFVPCYTQFFNWRNFKENQTPIWFFKCIQKNPRNKKTRVYSWIAFCRKEKLGYRKPDKNSNPGRLEFMPRNLDKEMRSRIFISVNCSYSYLASERVMVRPAVTRANTLKKTPTERKGGKTLKVHHVYKAFKRIFHQKRC